MAKNIAKSKLHSVLYFTLSGSKYPKKNPRMLSSAKIYNNQRDEEAVILDSNYTDVEEQCIPGNREDSHILPF